ncbi:hypothetical protein B0T18DRAFT_357569 [Schizothecium vesticola]|uniref:NDT80 domain-containing protein n=1 Tax=Schizothecium vesticola TaxID=314040 RepID=A0AA40F8Q7_9PEZI|nr:hypothetical protein B0T18DRAFT_357569 [Schizothecium vesticola]
MSDFDDDEDTEATSRGSQTPESTRSSMNLDSEPFGSSFVDGDGSAVSLVSIDDKLQRHADLEEPSRADENNRTDSKKPKFTSALPPEDLVCVGHPAFALNSDVYDSVFIHIGIDLAAELGVTETRLRQEAIPLEEVDEHIEASPRDTAIQATITDGGTATGTLSGTPSFLRLPNALDFLEVYVAKMDMPLTVGDCGSWIRDVATGKIFGHVVAGSPTTGLTIIMPANKSFLYARDALKRARIGPAQRRASQKSEDPRDSSPPSSILQLHAVGLEETNTGSSVSERHRAILASFLDAHHGPDSDQDAEVVEVVDSDDETLVALIDNQTDTLDGQSQGQTGDINRRMINTSGPGMAHAPRTTTLPHPGSQLTTRDLYSSAMPDHHLPRSPPYPAIRRHPLSSPIPSPISYSIDTGYGSKSQQNIPPLNPIVPLGHLSYNNQAQTPIKVEINGIIDKGFFLADNEWTCYRRNYFSCMCSYSISPPAHPNTAIQFLRVGEQQPYPVYGFAMCISAVVADNDNLAIELVQHTPKLDEGPIVKPGKVRLSPKPPQTSHHPINNLYTNSSRNLGSSRGYDQGFGQTQSNLINEHTFERVQFKQATANNEKRRALQEYYHLIVELWADTSTQGSDPYVRVAYRKWAKMIVRGRSPGHYQSGRRASSSSGPGVSGGSTTTAVATATRPYRADLTQPILPKKVGLVSLTTWQQRSSPR